MNRSACLPERRNLEQQDFAFLIELCRHQGRMSDSTLVAEVDACVAAAQRKVRRGHADSKDRCVVAADRLSNGLHAECIDLLASERPNDASDEFAGWRHRLLGHAYVRSENLELAVHELSRAVSVHPYFIDCWFELGQIHERVGKYRLAIAYYRRGVILEETTHQCALALARFWVRRKRFRRAIDVLKLGLARDRRSAELNTELGNVLRRQSRSLKRRRHFEAAEATLAGAAECFSIAVANQPSASRYFQWANVLQKLERNDQAIAALKKAVELDADDWHSRLQLANLTLDQGDVDEAVSLYERVLADQPNHAMAHFRYTRSKKFDKSVASRQYVSRLQTLIAATEVQTDLVDVHFAVAKVLDDMGDYDQAWNHYDQANRLKLWHSSRLETMPEGRRQQYHRRLADRQRMLEKSQRAFTKSYFQSREAINESELPIFIVGMPRSGTTLVEQILSSHSQVDGAGELKEIERLVRRLFSLATPDIANPDIATPDIATKARESKTTTSTETQRDSQNHSASYPECLATLDRAYLRQLAQRYLDCLTRHRGTGVRVTDKMPTNGWHLGLIATLFPKATVIHCVRNPMDVITSCYCQNLNSPFCDLDAVTDYYLKYQALMRHWYDVLPMKIHTIQYEALVNDPEPHIRAMIEHCGFEWEAGCLRFESNKRMVHTPSKWQVRQPMYSTSVEKWRRFESQLEPVAEALGLLVHSTNER